MINDLQSSFLFNLGDQKQVPECEMPGPISKHPRKSLPRTLEHGWEMMIVVSCYVKVGKCHIPVFCFSP
jgi:hypothetical protein